MCIVNYKRAMIACLREAIGGGVCSMTAKGLPDNKIAEVVIVSTIAVTLELVKHASENREAYDNLLGQIQNLYTEEINKGVYYDGKTVTH